MAKKKESPPKVGSHTEKKPLTPKEIDAQLKRGELTREQAIALRQRYMDSLEYNENQQFVTCCGGIKPLPFLPPPDQEE